MLLKLLFLSFCLFVLQFGATLQLAVQTLDCCKLLLCCQSFVDVVAAVANSQKVKVDQLPSNKKDKMEKSHKGKVVGQAKLFPGKGNYSVGQRRPMTIAVAFAAICCDNLANSFTVAAVHCRLGEGCESVASGVHSGAAENSRRNTVRAGLVGSQKTLQEGQEA